MESRDNSLTYEIYYNLREAVGWSNFSETQAREALKNSKYDVVFFNEEKAIGMGRVIGDGIYYIIVDVVVVPEFQGKGIGTKIINEIISYITENIPKDSRVSVQLISEKGKEPFYEKIGFKKIPNENCGSGMKKVIYT